MIGENIFEALKEKIREATQYIEKHKEFLDHVAMTSAICDALADVISTKRPEITEEQKRIAKEMYRLAKELYSSLRGDSKKAEEAEKKYLELSKNILIKPEELRPDDIRLVLVFINELFEAVAGMVVARAVELTPEEEQMLRAVAEMLMAIYERFRARESRE